MPRMMSWLAAFMLLVGLIIAAPRALWAQGPGGIQWISGSEAVQRPAGQSVFTRGNLMAVNRPEGWRVLSVVDDRGPYFAYVHESIWNLIPNADTTFVPGARVELYVAVVDSAGSKALVVNAPNHLRLSPTPVPTGVPGLGVLPPPNAFNFDAAPRRDVATAISSAIGTEQVVAAQIVSVGPPRTGSAQPWSIFVSDGSGPAGKVVIFQDTYNNIPNASELIRKGNQLELFVETSEYRGQRQLNVRRPEHIRLRPGTQIAAVIGFGDEYVPVTAATLNMRLVGLKVSVSGALTHYEPSPSPRIPHRLTLTDGPSAVNVVFWPEVYRMLDPAISRALDEFLTIPMDQRIAMGSNARAGNLDGIPARFLFRVSGRVTEFRDELQVNVEPEDQQNAPIGLFVP